MILVTGGTGYIASHTILELVNSGYSVIGLDNLSNSSMRSLLAVQKLTNKKIEFVEVDVCNSFELENVFANYSIDAVIHFAGLKSVSESVMKPLDYYQNNVVGTLNLIRAMESSGVKNMVFSSSATVYGDPLTLPIKETSPRSDPKNPYGMTKTIIENILNDLYRSDSSWNILNLRYFNPVGAHQSGCIGESPNGIPNNLMPLICQAASGKLESLKVFGDNYNTRDGTGVRDYIHVVDLARGHIKSLEKCFSKSGFLTINLGTGIGYSVLEMISAFEKASGQKVPYKIIDRRPGDVASCYADNTLASQLLNWQPQFGLREMCEDTWRWECNNPDGYSD